MLALTLATTLLLPSLDEPHDRFVEDDLAEQTLAEERRIVLDVIQEHLGLDLSDITFRLSDPAELRDILGDELRPQLRARMEPVALAEATADQLAAGLSMVLLAKYATATREILVCVDNIIEVAEEADHPALLARETLRAILVHECIHAIDHQRYDWPSALSTMTTDAEATAYNAVIEGHAQLVARDLCERAGWTDGFEAYTRMIGFAPDDHSAVGAQVRIAAATLGAAYHAGERFLDHIDGDGDQEAIDAAFADPPAEMELVHYPEWYLDRDLYAEVVEGFERTLSPFRMFDAKKWTVQSMAVGPEQIRAALTPLPADEIDEAISGLVTNRSLVANPIPDPQSSVAVGSALLFGDAAAASRYLDATRKLSELKDGSMREGIIKITRADYLPLEGDGWRGYLVEKQVSAMHNPITVFNGVLIEDDRGVELLLSGVPFADRELAEETLTAMLVASRGRIPTEQDG